MSVKDKNIVDDQKEKDVLLRSWISGPLIEENMYLIVGCSTAKKMWKCLEETYLQATKDKQFHLKQHLQSVRLGTKKIDEYIKEFKGIYVMVQQQFTILQMKITKVINFSRGIGHIYKTFRTVKLCKTPYPTLNQFVHALRGLDMREDKKKVPQ